MLSSPMVGMDETYVQVLNEPEREATDRSFMVVQVGTDGGRKSVLFTYRARRIIGVLSELLGGYQGILQTDGLKQYLSIGNGTGMTHILCWAHARRKPSLARPLNIPTAIGMDWFVIAIMRLPFSTTTRSRQRLGYSRLEYPTGCLQHRQRCRSVRPAV